MGEGAEIFLHEEVATLENTLGKLPLWKIPLGSCHLGKYLTYILLLLQISLVLEIKISILLAVSMTYYITPISYISRLSKNKFKYS